MTDRRLRGQRGTAIVEFALFLPFLALLTFATIDLGRAYSLHQKLSNAAREGAAYAQYHPGRISSSGICTDPENIRYKALAEDKGTAAGYTVTVTNAATGAAIPGPCTTGIAPGTRVKVTVTGTFTLLTPIAKAFISSPATLRRSAEVVVQG